MKKALLMYFSATGNTWLAAERIRSRLFKDNILCDLRSIEKIRGEVDLAPYSMIGIGYPIFLFSIPGYVYGFIKKLPHGKGRKAFVFATMGGGTFGSEALAALLLRNRGYRVIGAKPFVAANNDAILTGSVAPDAPETKSSLDKMLDDLSDWVDDLLDGKAETIKNTTGWKLAAAITGLAFRKLVPFHAFATPFWFLKADRRCNGCGLCERICPVGNIKKSLRKPRFGTRCIFCERCLNLCPQNSIHFLFSRWRPQYKAPGFRPPLLRKATY